MSLYLGKNFSGLEEYTITDVAYGNGITIVVGYIPVGNAKVIYKVDNGTWEYLSTPLYNPTSIAFCFDRFIVNSANTLYYSFDGFNWIQVTALGNNISTQFGYINGRYFVSTNTSTSSSVIINYYYTTNFITFTPVTFPVAPMGILHSFSNILAFIPLNGSHSGTARLLYTRDGINWLYKTTDTLYSFLPYDFSKPYIPTRSNKNIPGALIYKVKWFNNNLLVNDGIIDCNVYTSTLYDAPTPSSRDLFVFNGTDIIMFAALKLYSLNESGITYIRNLGDIIYSIASVRGFQYINGIYFIYGEGFCIYSSDFITWDSVRPGQPGGLKNVLVATTESKSLLDIRNVKPRDCEFHSDLKYVTYKKYNATVTDYGYVTHYTGYLLSQNASPIYSVVVAEFPSDFYNYLDRQLIVIVDNMYTLSNFSSIFGVHSGPKPSVTKFGHKWVNRLPLGTQTNYPLDEPVNHPSNSYRYLLVPKRLTDLNWSGQLNQAPYSVPSVSILVTNYKLDGTYVPPLENYPESGIKINNNSLIINNYNLFDLYYLSNVRLNAADKEIKTEQASLFIQSDSSLPGMKIQSDPNRTVITRGQHTLFDTFYGRRGHNYIGHNTFNLTNSIDYGNTNTDTYLILKDTFISVPSTMVLNTIIEATITATNVKHDNVNVGGAANELPYYNYTAKSYGAMSLSLNTNTPVLIGHAEYYVRVGSFEVMTFIFYKIYAVREIYGNELRLNIIIERNPEYVNSSANISVNVKAITFA